MSSEATGYPFGPHRMKDIRGTMAGSAECPAGSVVMSTFRLPGLSDAYFGLADDLMSVGPVYVSSRDGRFKDTQHSVTGSCIYHEDPVNAAVRELEEELGLHCDPKFLRLVSKVDDGVRTCWTYLLCAEHAVPYNPYIHTTSTALSRDDKRRKVQIVVAGPESTVVELVDSIVARRAAKDTTHIGGIRIMRVVDVKACLS